METSDILTAIGLVLSISLGLYNARREFRRMKSQNKLDDINSENSALELVERYSKKTVELQKRVDHLETMIEGSLHLIVKIPLGEVFKSGSATIDGVVAEIVKQKG